MIKSKFTTLIFLGLLSIAVGCGSSSEANENETPSSPENNQEQVDSKVQDSESESTEGNESKSEIQEKASAFTKSLEAGEELASYFNESWVFVYHEDNRCDGSTDGSLENLGIAAIDSPIKLEVKNDGEGWACEKKDPKTYEMEFDLKQKLKEWDRFEVQSYDKENQNSVYIAGSGESDYLKLTFNANKQISQLEYRSEDPG